MNKKNYLKVILLCSVIVIIGMLYFMGQSITKNSIPEPKISTNIELHSSDGKELPVYEMSDDDYKQTDFKKD